MRTVIFAHPWHGSFNHAILDRVTQILSEQNSEYNVIDLVKDNFNPVMSESDLAGFSKGVATDTNVLRYQDILSKTSSLIFIFPVWWYDMPAILKGFIDKVMLKNFAYVQGKRGLEGRLGHINSATAITTSESPVWYLKLFAGNCIQKIFLNTTMKSIGIKNRKWIHFDKITKSSDKKRERFLHDLKLKI